MSASRSPLPARRPGQRALVEFRPLRHIPVRRVRSFPGVPRPGTFRPQGLTTLSTACSSPHLGGPVDPPASMGFSLQGLAPPGQRYPSRGLASPVVSSGPPEGGPAATPEDDSGPGRGPTRHALAVAAEPCPPGRWPLQGFLLRAPSARLPGPSPSCPFGRKCSLRFHFRAGLQGIVCGGSGWSLSRLPALLGFGTFPERVSLRVPFVPGSWFRLGPEGVSPPAAS